MSAIATELSDLLITSVQVGPIGIIGLSVAEKLFPFVPSYVLFVVIGMVVAADDSSMSVAITGSAIGSTVGSLCWYGAGLALGERRCHTFIKRFGRFIGLTPERYRSATRAFERNLFVIIAVSQTIPVVRVYIAIPAGVLGVSLRQFLLGTFLGSLIWSGSFLALGYWVGDTNTDSVAAGLILVMTLLGLEALVVVGWRGFKRRRSQSRPAAG